MSGYEDVNLALSGAALLFAKVLGFMCGEDLDRMKAEDPESAKLFLEMSEEGMEMMRS